MERILGWLRQHFWRSRDLASSWDEHDPDRPMRIFADAESIVACFRNGEQVELEVLHQACRTCRLHMPDLIRDHNRTLQARRRSAA